ncbi:MAG: 16S rRNA (guanine(966)-N(2))-methyltransferase RsmD [Lachnospiraceae bacterium]|jgi:16S rRNA (guanine966-N2)-methyltransferase|nr:16S rRNA (guanine(966)-N(2))-methyltransferase RsmD [Lachnospiraceae bacterium]
MRVISGTARGTKLAAPRGAATRPTTDRIKETLFNIIAPRLTEGCLVLDLFAGSGALGIEALSRGAGYAVFVDNSPEACACIARNLRQTKLAERAAVLKQDFDRGLAQLSRTGEIKGKCFDLVFIDPPYQQGYEEKTLAGLAKQRYIGGDTLIVLETAADTDFTHSMKEVFCIEREKVYKVNKHLFVRRR